MLNSIFKDYDIRGRYPEQLNEAVFYRLGTAIYQVLRPKKIALGRDVRLSSDTLFLYLAAGLKSKGVKIIDLGKVSTPFCFWYSRYYKADALMITGSHNAKEENGLKIYSYKSGLIDNQTGLLKIKEKFEKAFSDFAASALPISLIKNNSVKSIPAAKDYQLFLEKHFRGIDSKLKIGVDFSNSLSAQELLPFLEKLKINFFTLNQTLNGDFPGHGPNPLEEASQKSLKVLVRSKKLNIGAIFDGDGDRAVFLDEGGNVIAADFILALFIQYSHIFNRHTKEKKKAVGTINLSRLVKASAVERQVDFFVSKVGRSHMRRLMKKQKAFVGGEKSGHYFFKDFYYGDSASWAFLTLLKILSKTKQSLSKLIKPYQEYIIFPEENFPFKGQADHIFNQLKERFKDGEINQLDGLRVDFEEWAFNLRLSNTESLWRLNLEGKNKEELEKIKKEIEAVLMN